MAGFGRNLTWVLGCLLVLVAVPLRAQENLDSGKTAAQLFASDCALCHKTPKGLAKPGRSSELDGFLREHYTASRESAAAIAAYLRAAGPAPVERGRAAKRTGKGDDKAKGLENKPQAGGKPSDAKPSDTKPGAAKPAEGKASEPKASETKPSEAKPSEPKASDPKPADAKPSEPKPAPGGKSD